MTIDSTLQTLPTCVILELTKRCNNKCLYCYTPWAEPSKGYEKNSSEMATGEIEDLIVKLQEELPLDTIALSGGEPLLREDLPEILSFISKRGLNVVVITNGTLLDNERILQPINEKILFQVTLLSVHKETHDKLAGREGAWESAVKGMLKLKRANANMIVVFVATKLNYFDLRSTAELALVLGAKGLMYNRMNLGAHNINFAEELLPTPSMILENLKTLEEIGEKYGMKSIVSVVVEPCIVPLGTYKHVKIGWCPMGGVSSYFTIDPAGNIRICNHSPTILGNIKLHSLKEIYYHHPYVRNFREIVPEECKTCDPELKRICCGGCKAAAEQCYGTLNRVDPFVINNKPATHS
jgi:pyrroloquinoline quinone biosynthesis protein E